MATGGVPKLPGALWLDEPDAHERIERKLRKGTVTAEQAERLHHWVDYGFLTFPIEIDDALCAEIDRDVASFWREKPSDLPFAFAGGLQPMSDADESRERKSPYRIMDAHSHSRAILQLYLDRQMFDHLELVFGEPAVAIQSIYFEYGSQQGPHRDPVYVQTTPPSHLIAGWIALEDINPKAGALSYFPGSHKLPYFEFEPGRFVFDPMKDAETRIWDMDEFNRQRVREQGLKEEIFTPKRGTASIWHASLLHGGSLIQDASLTRKSLVVHYSTRKDYKAHGLTISYRRVDESGNVTLEPKQIWTQRVLRANGCEGFDNPLRAAAQEAAGISA